MDSQATVLDPLLQRIQRWRQARMDTLQITPLRYARRELAPQVGWVVRDGDGWIVTQTCRVSPQWIRCSVLVGMGGIDPIWAVIDEGPG